VNLEQPLIEAAHFLDAMRAGASQDSRISEQKCLPVPILVGNILLTHRGYFVKASKTK
jgi:hypothetical protein